jgi:hypothetical protein
VGIVNLDGSPSNGESNLTLNLCEITDFIRGLQAKDLTADDRAALRSLLNELEAFVRTDRRPDAARRGATNERSVDRQAADHISVPPTL